MSKFYVTTAIAYVYDAPALHHIYEFVATDVLARYHRLIGDDTFFLTGTDEHGVKMVKTAAEQMTEPLVLADKMAAVFEQVWDDLSITNDDFIRTTQPRHKLAAQEIVRRMVAND